MSKSINAAPQHSAGKPSAPIRKKQLKKPQKTRYSRGVRGLVIAFSSLLSVLALLLITGSVYTWVLIERVNFEGETPFVPVDSLPEESSDPDFSGDVLENPDAYATSVRDIQLKGNTKNITNILLLGIDARTNSYSGRSDTMMILSINKSAKTVKLISLLRDTWVTIPGRDRDGDGRDDYSKLNAAYAFGGFDLLSKTIEQNFRLKIDQSIAVNFAVFPIVVNAMGGVDMTLSAGEASIVKVGGGRAGTYHLNGAQTLTYARIRHLDSDFGRTQRQRKVISALVEKAKRMNVVSLSNVLYKVFPQVRTNISKDELLGYAVNVMTYASYEVKTDYYLPQRKAYTGKYINGGAGLWLNDAKASVLELHEYIYG